MRTRLRRALSRPARSIAGRAGYRLVKEGSEHPIPADCDERGRELIGAVRPYTLTTPERIIALREAIRYIEAAAVPGAALECGVWRGGSMMAAAMTLLEHGPGERELYMFDTFDRMPPPSDRDVHISGYAFKDGYERALTELEDDPVLSYLPFEQVRALIEGTGYPRERLRFVVGKVEETIPAEAPERIALCRLDTDWYESTAHEMEHLYPRIAPGGVLIVDDYGEFLGARQAVDEHLARDGRPVMIHRVDASCRVIVLPGG